ncbi:hypothetical protein [Engelhardtia mirabilis]|uniref:Uncharacterized protein n=1 Tax=Engelhardtia mirabilis TaxID=2528011 RepID=A0A518BSW4_9BACT|nr:hypothetical protein Pla133_51900 [Planctomycetes bacterium Pla133]QDV04392.1 hypothetical protein Pla86_51870 [Planctomycetes bacterium Pla86]
MDEAQSNDPLGAKPETTPGAVLQAHSSLAAAPQAPRPRRWLRRLLALALVPVISLVTVELGLRFLLFSHNPTIVERTQWTLRKPQRFANRLSDDMFWALLHRWGSAARDEASVPDPITGWRGRFSRSANPYIHARVGDLEHRQPILLFGDSYAACTTSAADCFDGLFRDSDRIDDALLLNYGVGGFGLDQIYLTLRETLKAWDTSGLAKPKVIVSFFLDNDLDRCDLSIRDFPKPRFTVEDGQLVEHSVESPSGSAWYERNSSVFDLWTWRWLVHSSHLLPNKLQSRFDGTDRHREFLQEAVPLLFAAAHEELASRGIEHSFLILPGEVALKYPYHTWREPLVEQSLTDLGVNWVNARWEFEQHAKAVGLQPKDYFGTEGRAAGHYTPLGNRVAMQALLRAVDGDSDAGRRPLGYEPAR